MAIVQDFRFIYVNRAFIEMVGYSLEALNLMEPTRIIAPEDKERLTTQYRQMMQGYKEVKISLANFIRKDGTRFTAEFNSSLVAGTITKRWKFLYCSHRSGWVLSGIQPFRL